MSFTKTSRPGSGTEHIMAHFWECMELLDGKTPNYHGEDVGVTTLIMLRYYGSALPVCRRSRPIRRSAIGMRSTASTAHWPRMSRSSTPGHHHRRHHPPAASKACWPPGSAGSCSPCRPMTPALPPCGRPGKTTIGEVGKAPDFVEISFRFHPCAPQAVIEACEPYAGSAGTAFSEQTRRKGAQNHGKLR